MILALLLAGSLNLPVVEAAVEALHEGENPYLLPGVEASAAEDDEDLPDLTGCTPSLSESSTRDYLQVDFRCESADGAFVHRVAVSEGESELVRIYIDPLPGALGPTANALNSDDLPSARQQLNRLVRAVRRGEDPTLNGIIPLNQTQIEELSLLSDCRWNRAAESLGREPTWLSFVRCTHHDAGKGRMVEMQFDEEGRAVTVRVAYGATVRR